MTLKKIGCFMLLVAALAPFTQSAIAQSNTGGVAIAGVKPGNQSVIAGNVFDTDGEPLPGVTVKLGKDLTVTDADGAFVIKPNGAAKLVFSYIGKKTKEVKATAGKPMLITLDDDATTIKEVVVTGISTKDKSSFTGSASTFTADELKMIGVQNPIASLAALDPAFNVLTNELAGSDPNTLPDINIRGKSSVIGQRDELVNDPNQPLFIVDGFESTLEAVYNMDINRIESMTILKDAASTAIYGSKAANGVVVVETVKPKVGKLRFSYNGSVAMSRPDLSSYSLMNSKEKLEFERLAGRYDRDLAYGAEQDIVMAEAYNKRLADIQSGVDTYWLSVPLRTGWNQKHNVYVDGGANGFMFGLGLNYNGNTGVMKDSKRDTYTGNIDLIYRVGKLQFQNKFSAAYTDTRDPMVAFSEYANANPYYKKTDEDGNVTRWLENTDFARASNPLYNASLNSRNTASKLLLSNYFVAEYSPISMLKLKAKVGISHTSNNSETFVSPQDTRYENLDAKLKGSSNSGNSKSTQFNGALTAIFAHVIGKNRFNVAANFNLAQTKSRTEGYSVRGFPEGNYTYPSFSAGYPDGGIPSYNEDTFRSTDFMATINYSFDNRYLLDANYALNGSSVFGSNKKFINTWSVGLGWNIMNEPFMKEAAPWLQMLKVRASIGNPGNQDFSSAMSLITYSFLYNSFNYFGNSTILSQMGNRNLNWQTTTDRNIGLDFATNRWNLEFDYYDKNTDPLLISVSVPPSTGITSSWHTNLGTQRSKG
ncbi:MAG: SusC/RagA family TonB-linked outer membrane protein, partial [Duncaniella sp.]|nr:SusC/RagA family TonB-linked outer membrane protein [Duncaniella sp.]